MLFHSVGVYLSYAATVASLVGGAVSLTAPSVLPDEYLDLYPGGERGARSRGRISAILVGASLFPLLNGAPPAFLTLACCWLASAIERAIAQIPEREFTQFFVIGMTIDLSLAILISLPYLPV